MLPPLPGQVRDAAFSWLNAGVSVIPIGVAKRPAIESWTPYIAAAPTLDQAEAWWGNGRVLGYAIICGQVSGGLEMTEIEAAGMTEDAQSRFMDALDRLDAWDVYTTLWYGYRQGTPSGGVHLAYRISDQAVPGNEKVARRPATPEELESRPGNKFVVLAETRGEGGYFIGAGSPGICHPSGRPWELHHGAVGDVPTITWAQRELFHQALREALDETPAPAAPVPATTPPRLPAQGSLSPGDDFENRTSWEEILEPRGWQVHHRQGSTTHWTRPGKERRDGTSATTGRDSGRDRLYVFSTSTEFESERSYTKFGAYAILEHGGDHSAAASNLARQGYGDRPVAADAGDEFMSGKVDMSTGTAAAIPASEPAPTKFYDQNDTGNARRLWDRVRHRVRYVTEAKEWWRFDGRRWVEDPESGSVHRSFIAIADDLSRQARLEGDKEALNWARRMGNATMRNAALTTMSKFEGATVRVANFDTRRDLMNVPNGVLNPSTGDVVPHSPDLMMTRMFGTEYQPDSVAPTWDRYLSEVLPDEAMRAYVRRAVGYTLLAKPNQRSLFFIQGGSGTGKSTFLEVMRAMFGDYGTTVAASTFKEKRNSGGPTTDLHSIRGKRFVSTSETVSNATFEEDLLKRLSGGDSVVSREMFEKPVEWQPECVLWLATNFAPNFTCEDDAIWRRTKIIPFTQKFDNATADPYLKDKLLAELPGVLNWALAGAREFLDHGLGEPPEIAEQVQAHRDMTDPVTQFLDEALESGSLAADEKAAIRTQDLYRMYRTWSRDGQLMPLGARKFGYRVAATLGVEPVKRGGQGLMHWPGIGIGGGWITGAG